MAIDIRIGAIDPPGGGSGPRPSGAQKVLEGRVLSVRKARRGGAGGSATGARRQGRATPTRDPLGASVVTVLIPEGTALPADLAGGPYRALIRFVRR